MATNEERLQDTIQSIQEEEYRSIRQAALRNGATRSTVGHRLAGRKPRSEITLSSQRLTKVQENTLCCYIKDLQLQYQPPTHR